MTRSTITAAAALLFAFDLMQLRAHAHTPEAVPWAVLTVAAAALALMAAPGLWMQRITTKEPSDDQAEVAIIALNGAMALETKQGGELVIA